MKEEITIISNPAENSIPVEDLKGFDRVVEETFLASDLEELANLQGGGRQPNAATDEP